MSNQTEGSTFIECAGPGCKAQVEVKNGRGRKRRTCSDRCRKRVNRIVLLNRAMQSNGIGPSVLK